MRPSSAIVSAVIHALAGIGLLVDDFAPVERESGRPVLISVSAALAARVEDEGTDADEVATRLARAGRLVDEGAHLLPPLRREPLVLPGGRAVTVWPLATPTLSSAPAAAVLLRSLHDAGDRDLPGWDLLDELEGRSRELRQSPPESVRGRLAEWMGELVQRRPPLESFVPIHADAHGENVMRYDGGDVLIDLDGLALGPREYDLATWAVSQPPGGRTATDVPALVRAYGPDVVDPDVLAWCLDLSEANVLSWLVTDGRTLPGAEEEFHARLAAARPSSSWWNHAARAPGRPGTRDS